MSSLRNIWQRCGRNASILGGTPLQIQCASTSNPAYFDSICISRQTYSSDANEAPKNANDIVQKYILEMMSAKKSRSKLAEDQKEPESLTADSAQKAFCAGNLFRQMNAKTPIFYKNSNKWPRDIAAAQKASNSSTFHKNFNPCRYYITVRELSNETTPDSLREFYSQFGEIAINHALNSLPHCIDGKETKNVLPATLDREQRTLEVTNLSPRTTPESLKAFYSKFGPLDNCKIKKATSGIGRIGKVTFADQKYALSALNNGPHTIKGAVVDVRIAKDAEEKNAKKKSVEKKGKSVDTDRNKARLEIKNVPEGITEETLCAFYSKYGQVRECGFNNEKTFAFVLFSAVDEVNRAVDDRPHIINGNPLRALNALNSGPHTIEGAVVDVRKAKAARKKAVDEALNALNSGPHTIEGAVVNVVDVTKAKEAGKSLSKKEKSVGTDKNILRLEIKEVPEGITIETLIAHYSKYGQVREWRFRKEETGKIYAFVTYSDIDEVNRAVDDRPHIINGNLLRVNLCGRIINVSLLVSSLPKNIAEESLREEFSKYGKPVYWELRNDGKFDQSGPYGFVTYSSEQEALNALNSGPHTIESAVVDVRIAKEAGKSLSKEKSYN
ncbi:RNA recognition motif domain-containing protein [Ditylenchus destructor]|nr:RNA recognition motif domain-containing protein [Ditylenchus destructor]